MPYQERGSDCQLLMTLHEWCSGLRSEVHVVIGRLLLAGLHGANRLASNSLLEGLVFASRAVKPSVTHREYALKHAASALHHAAASADFTGSARAARYCGRLANGWPTYMYAYMLEAHTFAPRCHIHVSNTGHPLQSIGQTSRYAFNRQSAFREALDTGCA